MTKKSSVPIPEKKTEVLGSKPMRMGTSTVAPNMANTCCSPTTSVCPHGRRSSGPITPLATGVQRGKKLSRAGEGMDGSMGRMWTCCGREATRKHAGCCARKSVAPEGVEISESANTVVIPKLQVLTQRKQRKQRKTAILQQFSASSA